MPVNYNSSLDKLLDYMPDLIDKTNNMINKCFKKSDWKVDEKCKKTKEVKEVKIENKTEKNNMQENKNPLENEITYEYEYDETLDEDDD